MDARGYDSEDDFQRILSRHPELLAGEQIDRDVPRRWILVGREIAIPDSEESGGRWSLDHMFVDQDGIPTLVEVKRKEDPRVRREVIGQMFDYAAHAGFLTGPYLREAFEDTCKKADRDPGAELATLLASPEVEPAAFWQGVEGRLRDGDMRIIFLADRVPAELRRVVEFLNKQTTKTEIFAIEVQRYAGSGYSTHIPRLFGQTSEAETTKGPSRAGNRRRTWDEASFLEATSRLPPGTQAGIRRLLDLAKAPGFSVRWGTGAVHGSFGLVAPAVCEQSLVTVLSNGTLWLNMVWMNGSAAADAARVATKAFATGKLGIDAKWEQPSVPAEWWVPRVDDLVALLAGTLG